MTTKKTNGRNLNGFLIERDVPLPSLRNGAMDVIRNLEVGESVKFVDSDQARISASSRTIRQREPDKASRKYVTRTVEGGVRIWRTE